LIINGKYEETREFIKEKEKDILVGSVASGVAHEIRNPLNSINYMLEYMRAISTDEKIRPYLSMIKEEILRIERSLRDFLDMRREITYNREKIDFNDIAEKTLELMMPELEAERIEILIRANSRLEITGDRDRMKEVLVNFLKNSIEALRGCENKKITVIVDNNGFEVHDNGNGIGNEEMSRLFNLYYTTKEEGNGIGLYRTKKIVEAHGGEIDVKSLPGRGTKIKVSFKRGVADGGHTDNG
jgi:two-component system sensor histidine kinase AtoS